MPQSEARFLDSFHGFRQPFFCRAQGHADVAFVWLFRRRCRQLFARSVPTTCPL